MRTEYLPGDGLAVVAPGVAALLPEGCAPALVEALWTSVRAARGLTAHLEVLLGPGLAAAPAFALVSLDDGVAHVVVRGSASVEVATVEGPTTVTAAGVSTWRETAVLGASAARLGGALAATGAAWPLEAGVVTAAWVELGDDARVPLDPATVPPAESAEPAPEIQSDRALEVPPVGPAAQPDPEPEPEPEPAPDGEQAAPVEPPLPVWERVRPVRAERLAAERRPTTGGQAAVPPPPAPVPADVPLVREVPASVGAAPALPATDAPAPPTPAPVASAPVAVPSEDHDGLTVLSSDVVALRRELPEWAGDAVPRLEVPTPRTPPPAKLQLSTGLVVSLNRPVLLGRAPQVTRMQNDEIPRLITVSSPNQDISRTHAEVRMDGEDVVVTDLRSTNGVLLLRQGQGAQRLHPGEPTVVEPGVVVDLGDGVTFLVEAGG